MKIHNIEDMTPASPPDGSVPDGPDLHPTSELGCFLKTLAMTANAIHFTQCIAGITGLSYAIVISFHKPDPQHGIAILLEIYSLILFTAGSMGLLGISKPNCKRITLKISLMSAPFLACSYCILAFILLVEKSSVQRYLKEKETQLYISDREVQFIVTSYYILFALAAVEGLRFYIVRKLKNDLDEFDQAQRRGMLHNHARTAAAARRSWDANPHNDREPLTTPLLLDNGGGGGDVSSVSSQRQQSSLQDESTASWWEEPEEKQSSSLNISGNSGSGGWMSRVFNSSASASSDKNGTAETTSGGVKEDCNASTSSAGFAPIDDELETGSTPWHDTPKIDNGGGPDLSSAGFSPIDDELETGSTPWHDTPTIDNGGEPDLGWANQETDL